MKTKRKKESPKPKAVAAKQGFFQASDGTSLYYEVRGTGRPLLFCYGLTCRREHWRYQVAHLADRYQVILFDYRGHHASDRPANDRNLTIEWCARDVVSLLEHLGLEEVVALGHSMGVAVLTEAIRRAPARFRAAIFVCGAVNDPFSHMLYTDRLAHVFRAYSALCEWAPDTMSNVWKFFTRESRIGFFITSRLGFNPSMCRDEDVLGYLRGVADTPLPVFYALLSDYTRFDGRPVLRQIPCPVLVIAGDRDCITPIAVQEKVAELLPKGELFKVPYGSHNAHSDFPDKVNEAIDKFLKRIKYQ